MRKETPCHLYYNPFELTPSSKNPVVLSQSPIKNGNPSSSLSASSSLSSSSSGASSNSLISMATVASSISSASGSSNLLGGPLQGNMGGPLQNSGSYSSATQQQTQQSQQQHQPKNSVSSLSNANSASSIKSTLLPTSTSTSPPNTSTLGPLTPSSQSQPPFGTGLSSSLGLGKGTSVTSGTNQMPSLVLSGMPASVNSMTVFLSGSTPAPYAQAAAAGCVGSGLSASIGTNISSTNSSGVVTSVGTNGSLVSTSLLDSGPSVLGLGSTQSAVEPLPLVAPSSVGGALTSGSNVGVIGSNGGTSGTGNAEGSAMLPRPPSGPKQNGGTSQCRIAV